MDWTNRGASPTQTAPAASAPTQRGKGKKVFGGLRLASVALLFSVTALLVAVIYFLVIGGASETKFVKDNRMQAVFLNGGQVYFGRIKNLDDNFMRLSDIYYLRVNQQVQPNQEGQSQATTNDISLVKLGCELHGPEDQMLINREQIIFWENLKDDGQVAKAVAEYVKANPDGQKCETQSQSQTQTTPTTTTPTTTTPTTTKPTTTTPTTTR